MKPFGLARLGGGLAVVAAVPFAVATVAAAAPAVPAALLPAPVTVPGPATLPSPTPAPMPTLPPPPANLPAPPVLGGGVPSPPTPLGGGGVPSVPGAGGLVTLPGRGAVPTPPVAPPAPGGSSVDICSQVINPVTAAGAPIAAACPIAQTPNGGSVSVCVVVSEKPSCADPHTAGGGTTTTTTDPGGHGTGSSGGSGGSSGSGASDGSTGNGGHTATLASSPAAHHGSTGTLPFTGTAAVLLALVGTGLVAAGTAAARFARRRRLSGMA